MMPAANDEMSVVRASLIQASRSGARRSRIMAWNRSMAERASATAGTSASTVATRIASILDR